MAKAYYRRATAYMGLHEFPSAKADLIKAAKLEPKSREIRDQLDNLKEQEEQVRVTVVTVVTVVTASRSRSVGPRVPVAATVRATVRAAVRPKVTCTATTATTAPHQYECLSHRLHECECPLRVRQAVYVEKKMVKKQIKGIDKEGGRRRRRRVPESPRKLHETDETDETDVFPLD